MKVLHFLPWYSPRTAGGTERFLLDLARLQQRFGDEVSVTAPNQTREPAEETVEGVPVRYFPYPYDLDASGKGLEQPNAAAHADFLRLVRDLAPDVVHLHGFDHFFQRLVAPLAIPGSPKLCMTVHLVNVVCPNHTLVDETQTACSRAVAFDTCASCISRQRRRRPAVAVVDAASIALNRVLTRSLGVTAIADRIGYQRSILRQQNVLGFLRANVRMDALSPWFREVLLRNGFPPERTRLRPNPLFDAAHFVPAPPLVRNGARVRLLVVGRVSTEKGMPILVDALSRLASWRDAVDVTLLGRHDEPELITTLGKLRETGFHLRYPGAVPADQVRRAMREADFLIFPSSQAEMAPLAIQEALQQELPVICGDQRSATAYVKDGLNGLLFRQGAADDLARVLRSVVERDERMRFTYAPPPAAEDALHRHYHELYSS